MNGEDLKFLAERTSGLEDRTAVRLEEVHDRIAAARRRRVVAGLTGAACLVLVVAVGVGIVNGGRDDASPDPAPTLPEQSTSMPQPGTCWNVPVGTGPAEARWFDDSAQVPCTEPHTSETAQAVELTEATIAEAKIEDDLCWDYARNYVGIDGLSWVPWDWAAYLPSKEEVAAGVSWLRCDVVFPAAWDFSALRTVSVPAEGLADDPPPDFWACLDEHPSRSAQPFVPCDQPHAYEETGTLVNFTGIQEYPSPSELAAAERQQCGDAVPAGYGDVAVTASWDPRSAFVPGNEINGACFMYHADGTPLPPRQP